MSVISSLTEIDCVNCAKVPVQLLKYMLSKNQNLKCCNIGVIMNPDDDSITQFATLVNSLVGQVNLSLDALERVPSTLLEHPGFRYRSMFPTGQVYE